MSTDPIAFLKETFPALFNSGLAQLRAKADGGDALAKSRLEDVLGATGAVRLVVEGEGEVLLSAEGGEMRVLESAEGQNVRLAVGAPAAGLRRLLLEAEAEGELAEDKAAERAVATASKRVQDILGEESMLFHVVVKDIPELGEVTAKIGLNAADVPAEPTFTATLSYPDLGDVRDGKVQPQELFFQQKLVMAGDYSRALQVGMQLATLAQQELAKLQS